MPTLEISGPYGCGKTTLARTLRASGTPLRDMDSGEQRRRKTGRSAAAQPVERYESTDSIVDLTRALIDLGYRPITLGDRVIVSLPTLTQEA